ncbi:MAG: hypothetical protein DRP08_04840, partial [Candidatus Aenigmatarchaeota archaeon]
KISRLPENMENDCVGCVGDLEDNQTYGWIDNWEYNMRGKEKYHVRKDIKNLGKRIAKRKSFIREEMGYVILY